MFEKNMRFFILSLLTLAIFVSFLPLSHAKSSKKEVTPSNLTFGMVKSQIEKGKTTQADILKTFGPPNIMTRNRSGEEVWTYDKISSESKSSTAYGTLVILGASGKKSSSSQKTMTLMVTFDGKDTVKDYSVMSTQF